MNNFLETPEQLLNILLKRTNHEGPNELDQNDVEHWINTYNQLTELTLQHFPSLPLICAVKLIPLNAINANDYNPNKMGKPESRLLLHSLEQDGLTLPIIVNRANANNTHTLIDGFHRYELLKANPHLQPVKGYVPALVLNKSRCQAMASSIRHNIARGVHQVELTADMVILLKQSNWSNEKIGIELGMDKDEVLRMQQITGLAEIFRTQEFSKSWE